MVPTWVGRIGRAGAGEGVASGSPELAPATVSISPRNGTYSPNGTIRTLS